MKSQPTTSKVIDHCGRLQWRDLLGGFTVEDTDMIQLTEVPGLRLLAPLVHFKIRLLGDNEDFVVFPDVQLDLGRAALSVDTRDGEVIDVGDLRCGDHGQVDHGICRTGKLCLKQTYRTVIRGMKSMT